MIKPDGSDHQENQMKCSSIPYSLGTNNAVVDNSKLLILIIISLRYTLVLYSANAIFSSGREGK